MQSTIGSRAQVKVRGSPINGRKCPSLINCIDRLILCIIFSSFMPMVILLSLGSKFTPRTDSEAPSCSPLQAAWRTAFLQKCGMDRARGGGHSRIRGASIFSSFCCSPCPLCLSMKTHNIQQRAGEGGHGGTALSELRALGYDQLAAALHTGAVHYPAESQIPLWACPLPQPAFSQMEASSLPILVVAILSVGFCISSPQEQCFLCNSPGPGPANVSALLLQRGQRGLEGCFPWTDKPERKDVYILISDMPTVKWLSLPSTALKWGSLVQVHPKSFGSTHSTSLLNMSI